MNKKHRQLIDDNLSKALEPPKKKTPPPALNEILSQYTPPSSTIENKAQPTPPTPLTADTPPTPSASIAPSRDFTKVANSIVRAVPSGLFAGKSKLIYDFLYSKTRGAIVPGRSVRITKENLMRGAGIGSERTLYKNLKRLMAVGLIQVRSFGGEQAGSEYTVFLPEEATHPPHPPHPPHPLHKVGSPPTAQSGVGRVGLNGDAQDTSVERKTLSFKTNTIDDDNAGALSDLNAIFCEATLKITGRGPQAADRERWTELARVLVSELEIAAARTTVSSVPSFLAEHLRRRLWKIDKQQAHAEGRELPDETMPAASSERAVDCPDCKGSGWWYPEGMDRGVAKCKHEKLRVEG
jgi:hypothetical protein